MVAALKNHTTDSAYVCEHGCWALSRLAAGSDAPREFIAATDGIKAVVAAPQVHRDSRQWSSGTLPVVKLAKRSDGKSVFIAAAGSINTVVPRARA
jgi:hypothetical protein